MTWLSYSHLSLKIQVPDYFWTKWLIFCKSLHPHAGTRQNHRVASIIQRPKIWRNPWCKGAREASALRFLEHLEFEHALLCGSLVLFSLCLKVCCLLINLFLVSFVVELHLQYSCFFVTLYFLTKAMPFSGGGSKIINEWESNIIKAPGLSWPSTMQHLGFCSKPPSPRQRQSLAAHRICTTTRWSPEVNRLLPKGDE